MPFVQTQWWGIELPEEWAAQAEDDTVSLVDCDELGSIDISAIRRESGDVTRAELEALAQETIAAGHAAQEVSLGPLTGIGFEYLEQGEYWREWYLGRGPLLLLVTYNCDAEHRDFDRPLVDDILSTITINEEGEV